MDPSEELYGVPRLREVLTGQSECALEKLQKSILESVENFAKGAHQADDLTLLIVRYRSTPAVALTETDLSSSSSKVLTPSAGSPVSVTPSVAPEVASQAASAAASKAIHASSARASGAGTKSISSAETIGPPTS
jgi:hypothetical protein